MTATVEIQRHVRKFRVGATLLPDPAPELAPEEAIKLYHGTYPHLAFCTLEEGGVEGDALIYVAQKPVAQTKGARRKASIESTLDAWVDASKEIPLHVLAVGGSVAEFARDRLERPSSPIDAFDIPLA